MEMLDVRPGWIWLVMLTAVLAGCGEEPAVEPAEGASVRSPRPPNIVLIYADDLDFDEIGVAGYADELTGPTFTGHLASQDTTRGVSPYWGYGGAQMHTPHLESLARDGALFERFYVTSPVCNPSRFSLLTGQQATRSSDLLEHQPAGGPAMVDFNALLRPGDFTLARALSAAGYATGVVGKWDLSPRDAPDNGLPKGVNPEDDARNPRVRALIEEAYERGRQAVMARGGFDSAERIYQYNKESMQLPKELQVHNMEWITEGALEFIDAHSEEPFLLYMAPTVPHGWLDARIAGEDPRATPAGWLTERPQGMPPREQLPARLKQLGIGSRSVMATWLDDAVGAVLDRLEAHGIAENTIVIFSSDHQNRGKSALYEGARVPMLLRWPGRVEPGTRVSGNRSFGLGAETVGLETPRGHYLDVGCGTGAAVRGLAHPRHRPDGWSPKGF